MHSATRRARCGARGRHSAESGGAAHHVPGEAACDDDLLAILVHLSVRFQTLAILCGTTLSMLFFYSELRRIRRWCGIEDGWEDLDTLGKSGATLAVHLSVNNLAKVVRELTPHYGEDCPVVVAYRATWPDEQFVHGTLADIRAGGMSARGE